MEFDFEDDRWCYRPWNWMVRPIGRKRKQGELYDYEKNCDDDRLSDSDAARDIAMGLAVRLGYYGGRRSRQCGHFHRDINGRVQRMQPEAALCLLRLCLLVHAPGGDRGSQCPTAG